MICVLLQEHFHDSLLYFPGSLLICVNLSYHIIMLNHNFLSDPPNTNINLTWEILWIESISETQSELTTVIHRVRTWIWSESSYNDLHYLVCCTVLYSTVSIRPSFLTKGESYNCNILILHHQCLSSSSSIVIDSSLGIINCVLVLQQLCLQ